jgi:hypothetical protein
LIEKDVMAIAVHYSFSAFEILTFYIKRFTVISQPKQPMLFKDNFHSFKPLMHSQMVIYEVGQLDGSIQQHGIPHVWTTWM